MGRNAAGSAQIGGPTPTFSRVAVVGCGARFSSAIGPALAHMGVQPVLLVDPDPAALRNSVASLRTKRLIRPSAPTAEPRLLADEAGGEALRAADPDAVIIASPTGMHLRHALAALELGAATYVEKPLTCSAQEGHHLVGAHVGRRSRARLSVSEQRTYRSDLRLVRELLEADYLGELRRVTYYDSVARTPHFAASWRNDPLLAGGGVLFDLGYHSVATLHWLLDGEHRRIDRLAVQCAWIRYGDLRVEEEAHVIAAAATVEVRLTVRLSPQHGPGQERLTIEGSRGRATLVRQRARGLVSTLTLSRRSCSQTIPIVLGPGFDTESLREFMSPRPTPTDQLPRHLRTLEFLEQAYVAAQGG